MTPLDVTLLDPSTPTITTGLRGYLICSQELLEEILDSPSTLDDDKVSHEWAADIGGTLVRVYSYKSRPPYDKSEDFEWHIGGTGVSAVLMLNALFEQEARSSDWAIEVR